jgi:hypothetical protein
VLDRLLKLIVTLTLLLFLVDAVIDVLSRAMGMALARAISTIDQAKSFVGALIVALGVICLFAGLLIRFIRWLREGGLSGRRPHRGLSTRQEWAGREFADEVPVHRTSRRSRSRRRISPPGERE